MQFIRWLPRPPLCKPPGRTMLENELPHSLSRAPFLCGPIPTPRTEIILPILVVLSLLLWAVFHVCLSPWGTRLRADWV